MIEDRLAKVEARLRQLEDLEEIRALRLRYHRCVNERIFKEAVDIHTEDAFIDFAGQAKATVQQGWAGEDIQQIKV